MLKLALLAIITLLFAATGCGWSDSYTHLRRADELRRQDDPDGAIAEYRRHIAARLKDENRPEWENPYFYLLLIGDLQLGQGKFQEAIDSFELAGRNGVDSALVTDRYLYVAQLHADAGRIEEAIRFLEQYRDRDPLLFNIVLDRFAKMLVQREELSAPLPPRLAPAPQLLPSDAGLTTPAQ